MNEQKEGGERELTDIKRHDMIESAVCVYQYCELIDWWEEDRYAPRTEREGGQQFKGRGGGTTDWHVIIPVS